MDNIKLEQIAAECTAARKLCGVTIKQIAEEAGVSPATISRFEHNKCDSIFVIAAYYKLCPVLGTGKLQSLMSLTTVADRRAKAPGTYYHVEIDDLAGLSKLVGTTECESVHDVVMTKLKGRGARPGLYVWQHNNYEPTIRLYQRNLAGYYEIPLDELQREVVLMV